MVVTEIIYLRYTGIVISYLIKIVFLLDSNVFIALVIVSCNSLTNLFVLDAHLKVFLHKMQQTIQTLPGCESMVRATMTGIPVPST